MSEQLNLPEGHEQPSISSGVMHGPYPQTEAHPWDQSNGHNDAVDDAFASGRIGHEQRDAMLEGPVTSSMLDDHSEEIRLEEEANGEAGEKREALRIKNLDHEEALEENVQRDKAAAYIEKNGKPTSYDYYLDQGHNPIEALDLALDDDAHGPDAEDLYRQEMDEEEDNEDPLAGDVEPTGGYYEPKPGAFEAHRLSVMRQHGDHTES
jgi:hypothetical protein